MYRPLDRGYSDRQMVEQEFESLDRDGSGGLDLAELQRGGRRYIMDLPLELFVDILSNE